MICVFEPVCTHGEHAPFNAAMLAVATTLSTTGKALFFADATHIPHVMDYLSNVSATASSFQQITVANRRKGNFISRLITEIPLLSRVWRNMQKSKAELLIITGVTEPGLLAIKLFFLFRTPSCPVIVIFHGILPRFLYSVKRRLFLTTLKPAHLRYVVLGPHILLELERLYPDARRFFSSITHPYIFKDNPSAVQEISAQPVFAFVGLATSGKGFPEFLTLINKFNPPESRRAETFYLIGAMSDECFELFEKFKQSDDVRKLWYSEQSGPLPLEIYLEKMAAVDYLVMPYRVETYSLICSGSALDSMVLLKPIIALRSPFFEVFFEKLGDVGYLCNDLQAMSELIEELASNPPIERYQRQQENLKLGRTLYQADAVASELKGLLA